MTDCRVVDNRVFLLGLDNMYREQMKQCEENELLSHAQNLVDNLGIKISNVPTEGYYHENRRLTEYFTLMRNMQAIPREDIDSKIYDSDSYKQLHKITSSRIFGLPYCGEKLFDDTKDPLSLALQEVRPWNINNLVEVSYENASSSDDFSLVGLAALSKDATNIAALRESVVLYQQAISGCLSSYDTSQYEWRVDDIIQERATFFVDTFNKLFNANISQPTKDNAGAFYHACDLSKIDGRCVRIGYEDELHYHWAINNNLIKDFWAPEIWTTERYAENLTST